MRNLLKLDYTPEINNEFPVDIYLGNDGETFYAEYQNTLYKIENDGTCVISEEQINAKLDPRYCWVYNRTEEHIQQVLSGNVSIGTIDRATISVRTFSRWKKAVTLLIDYMNEKGLTLNKFYYMDLPNTGAIVVTNPEEPIYTKVTYDPEWYDPRVYASNPLYYVMYNMLAIIRRCSIDTSDLNLPTNTEYLHWLQINDLEKAMYRASVFVMEKYSSNKNYYSGNYISGGHIK